ncbi:hypothetical protein FRC00_003071 [Tulasnella sp. 408]|nr:hypothetical protein FRC00_003071 [Tulasnella sp. 408]
MVSLAYERYLDISPSGKALATGFKRAFSVECPIEFLGLWDTVASVGVLPSKHLPLTASNGGIKIVRQALALDERRAKFKPSLWHQSSKSWSHLMGKQGDEFSQDPTLSKPRLHTPSAESIKPTPSICSESTIHSGRPPSIAETFGPTEDRHARDYDCNATQTDVKEVWFAGCHPDVGGRLFEATGASLSDPSFRWMFNQILAANVPMYFRKEALNNLKYFNVHESRRQLPSGPVMTSKGSHSVVEKLEQKDAVSAATAEMRDHLQRETQILGEDEKSGISMSSSTNPSNFGWNGQIIYLPQDLFGMTRT